MRHQMRSVTSSVRGSMNERSELAWSRSCEVLGAWAIECRWNGRRDVDGLDSASARAFASTFDGICENQCRLRGVEACQGQQWLDVIVMVIEERCLDSVREQAVEYL